MAHKMIERAKPSLDSRKFRWLIQIVYRYTYWREKRVRVTERNYKSSAEHSFASAKRRETEREPTHIYYIEDYRARQNDIYTAASLCVSEQNGRRCRAASVRCCPFKTIYTYIRALYSSPSTHPHEYICVYFIIYTKTENSINHQSYKQH